MAACFPSPETKVSSHMKLRLALALSALALPAYAQSLPTPNLGTGTKLNGANLQNAATKATGTSVADPGTGALENLLPVQTFAGASHTLVAADLYRETRRSNSGSAMTDTFPGTSTAGLANGTMIQLNNVDTSASITLSAGAGTTLNGNASVVIPPSRSTKWVYDALTTTWRTTMNSLSGVNGPASATSGNIASFNGATGTLIQDSGKALPSGTIVGTTDTQTLTNKSIDASEVSSGTLGGARLPPPTSTVLGGIKSSSAGENQFATGVDTTGAVTYAQPAFSNVSGTATATQQGITSSLASSGYTKLVNGLIIQWGTGTPSSGSAAITFPTAFTSAVYSITATFNYGNVGAPAASEMEMVMVGGVSTSGFTGYSRFNNGSIIGNAGQTFYWTAIGQ
jgi:hypothetical protein